jgi:NitT/TauT family transport system permease protein
MIRFLPLPVLLAALLTDIFITDSSRQMPVKHPYFTYVLIAALAIYIIALVIPKCAAFLKRRAAFIAGVFLFLTALNLLTSKFAHLPGLYFPSLDRIISVLVNDHSVLVKCVAYSGRLLFFGYFGGAIIGFLTGVTVGFSKKADYWLSPIIRIIGPIPSTAWIPLILIIFPTAVSASAFLVGLAVWFPTSIMTSSGIFNIRQIYFEVGDTLGVTGFRRITRIGVPAAMPHVFLGLFNGTCASFLTLVTAEMIGAKYGIGWYINWQRDMLSYSNVYAALVIIGVCFSILITLLFKIRDKVLLWQKGVIKW